MSHLPYFSPMTLSVADLSAYPLTKGCWLGCAAVFLAAAVLDWWSSKRDDHQLKVASLWLLRGGWLTLTVMLAYHGLRAHTLPINSPAEILLSIGWGLTGLAGFLDLTFNHRLPTWAIAAAAAICLLAASFVWDPFLLHEASGKPLIAMHVGAAILAYCVLAAQALNSAAYLLQHRALERRQFGGIYSLLPALVPLDRIGSQMLGAAVWLLGLSLVIGATDWVQRDLPPPGFPKLASSLIAWAAALFVTVQRRRNRLSGAAFARASLWAFIPALIALYFAFQPVAK